MYKQQKTAEVLSFVKEIKIKITNRLYDLSRHRNKWLTNSVFIKDFISLCYLKLLCMCMRPYTFNFVFDMCVLVLEQQELEFL